MGFLPGVASFVDDQARVAKEAFPTLHAGVGSPLGIRPLMPAEVRL